MNVRRKKEFAALCINISLVLIEAAVVFSVLRSSDGGRKVLLSYSHFASFFALLASSSAVFGLVEEMRGRRRQVRYAIRLFRFTSISSLLLVFFVVIFILVPMNGFSDAGEILFSSTHFLEYIVCPLLSFLSFWILNEYAGFRRREAFLALLPTVFYAVLMGILNCLNIIYGPYFFFCVHDQSIAMTIFWFVTINGAAFVIPNLLIILSRYRHSSYRRALIAERNRRIMNVTNAVRRTFGGSEDRDRN